MTALYVNDIALIHLVYVIARFTVLRQDYLSSQKDGTPNGDSGLIEVDTYY